MSANETQDEFNLARRHQMAGRLQDAERICRQILQHEPRNADVLHMLGVIAWQMGRFDAAVDFIRQAVKRNPNFPEAHYNLGNVLRDQGYADAAGAAYGKAIALKPGFIQAYGNLGALLAVQGRLDEAIGVLQKAIAIDPNFPDAHYNHGNALLAMGRVEEAIAAFRCAVAVRPDYADAWYNLGNTLGTRGDFKAAVNAWERALAIQPAMRKARGNISVALCLLGRVDEAVALCGQGVNLCPDSAESICDLAQALKEKGLFGEAVSAYRRAVALDDGLAAARRGLAKALEMQGNISEALAVLKLLEQRTPGSVSSYDFAALGAGEAPPQSPRQYLLDEFDNYAGYFDQHLVGQLHYAGPRLLLDAVLATRPAKLMDIVDLGCGTGLCGQLFRSLAGHLTGVDLSPQMIAKAKQRGVYDQLQEMEISTALAEMHRSVDLILAADVFIYVGCLAPVFQAAAAALRPGGMLAFTIECAQEQDYFLQRSRRYAQSVAYIRRLSADFGLTEVSQTDAEIRREKDVAIEGKVIVLRLNEEMLTRQQ